jgi:DME family drug/metabolite transporter
VRRGRGGAIWPRLLVVAGATLWGTTGTTLALAPPGATAATVGSTRVVLGALALVAAAGASGVLGDVRAFARPGLRGATVTATAAMAAYHVTFFAGVARAGVAVGTIVGIGSAPVFTGVLGWVLRGERPERRWWPATVLAVAGSGLLAAAGGTFPAGGAGALGVLLALGAGASYAVFTLAGKALLVAGRQPAAAMAVTFGGAGLLLLPVLLRGDVAWLATPGGIAVALWLGAATVGLAYVLFATGLRALPAATVATLTLAEPLTAALLGVSVLGERVDAQGLLGIALVACGLGLLVARRRAVP